MDEEIKNINEILLEKLSQEEKVQLAKRLGITAELPSVFEHIKDEKIYSVNDIASLLKFTPQHIRRLCSQGKLIAIQIEPKGKYLIFGKHIKEFLNKYLYRSKFSSRITP